jgi:heat shock protein HtpX
VFRQILGCLLTFLGVLLAFFFWYRVIPLEPWFVEHQWNPENFLYSLALWAGLGGFSCLFLSKHISNWAMNVDLLPLDQPDPKVQEAELLLKKVAARLHLSSVPRLGVYESPELNAFIVGLDLSNSTLAISRGALQQLTTEELDVLLCRELLHMKSGDPIALIIMQGMVFAFTLYVARMLAFLLGTSLRATEEESTSSDAVEILVTSVLTVLLTLPGAVIFWFFSRSSALRADAATSAVVGPKAFTSFLKKLPGEQPLRREIFSDAFKLQSRSYPRGLGWWQTMQPPLSVRVTRISS